MTDLQLSLMAIGGTIVVGVVSYNKWREYKARKTVERAFASSHDDVLMTPGDEGAETGSRPSGRAEPRFMPADDAEAAAASNATANAPDPFEVDPASPLAQGMQEIASVYKGDAPSGDRTGPAVPSAAPKELPVDALVRKISPV